MQVSKKVVTLRNKRKPLFLKKVFSCYLRRLFCLESISLISFRGVRPPRRQERGTPTPTYLLQQACRKHGRSLCTRRQALPRIVETEIDRDLRGSRQRESTRNSLSLRFKDFDDIVHTTYNPLATHVARFTGLLVPVGATTHGGSFVGLLLISSTTVGGLFYHKIDAVVLSQKIGRRSVVGVMAWLCERDGLHAPTRTNRLELT